MEKYFQEVCHLKILCIPLQSMVIPILYSEWCKMWKVSVDCWGIKSWNQPPKPLGTWVVSSSSLSSSLCINFWLLLPLLLLSPQRSQFVWFVKLIRITTHNSHHSIPKSISISTYLYLKHENKTTPYKGQSLLSRSA